MQSFLPQGGMGPGSGYDFLLGQAPMPTASGGQPAPAMVGADGQPVEAPQAPTIVDQQAIQALKPTNFALEGQGQQSFYSNAPAAPDAPPPGFLANAKGAHGIWNYQMGKIDPSLLGQPLPGTAPPPGTNIPLGVADFLPDPAAPPPSGTPLPPGAPPIIPPPVG